MRVLLWLLCHEVNKDCEWTIDPNHEDHDDDAIEKNVTIMEKEKMRKVIGDRHKSKELPPFPLTNF